MTPCTDCLFCFVSAYASSNRNRFGTDDLYDMLDDISTGLTDKQVKEKWGVSRDVPPRLRTLAGLPKKEPRVPRQALDIAEKMLDDGQSFTEISRTTGTARETLRKYFPGRAYTQEQINERAALGRMEAQIFDRGTPLHTR